MPTASKGRGKCIFNAELAKSYPFIKKDDGVGKGNSDVFCTICKSGFSIAAMGRSAIGQHIKVDKHLKALQAASGAHTIAEYFAPDLDATTAAYEGVWAYHTIKANHSFLSTDCESKLFRTCFAMRKFHCARTKCEAIVTNVFAPYASSILQDDLSERNFVCISTDASNHGYTKMIPVVVRYFNPTVGVNVKMIDFTSQKGETSEIIASLIRTTVEKKKLVEKMVGFCGDNCATNFGSQYRGGRNNVYYRLKHWRPSLVGVGCAAHIVHNSIKSACDMMPYDIEAVVVKIYKHFYIHTVRVEALKEFCDMIDGTEYSKLLGYSNTRFLALGPAIGSILNIFEPIKAYFKSCKKCPTVIETFFDSPFAKLYLLFVKEQVEYKSTKKISA